MIDPFKKISESDKEKLFKNLEAFTYTLNKGTSIMPLLTGNDLFGLVIEGRIQIIRLDPNGNRTIIEDLAENGIFGSSISRLNDNEHEIITKEETKLLIVDFFNILNFHQEPSYYFTQFILNLLEITKAIINERNERIQILTQKTIRNRLLKYFSISTAKTHSKIIYLPFNYTDLADYLAVDRSAMSREMGYLKQEGIIDVRNRKITLKYSAYPARKQGNR